MPEIRELIEVICRDQWRETNGFSPDIEKVHRMLFGADGLPSDLGNTLGLPPEK
jgi:hypothetical protein